MFKQREKSVLQCVYGISLIARNQKLDNRTITLPADLVDRLEALAENRGRSVGEMFGEMLSQYAPAPQGNWAMAVAEGMEAADIAWIDDPNASVNSRDHFERYLREKSQRTQSDAESND